MDATGKIVTISNVCAFCGTNFGDRGPIILCYCIAWAGPGRPCNKAFCPDCSTQEQRQALLCPDHKEGT